MQQGALKSNHKTRPFLKWPGGKYRLLDQIHTLLPAGKQLIEPFVGGGALFLNSAFDKYLLNDANVDLITLYQLLQKEGSHFIKVCRKYFSPKYNTEKNYYRLRLQFNASTDPTERSALFLFLNRHGFNGLIRYNAGKKEFNVPFGQYDQPYFPEKEMLIFHERSQNATFVCEDFSKTMARARKGSVVYCDPPYVPLNDTANFTSYQAGGFSLEQQKHLGVLARALAKKGIPVLLSNHSNAFTQEIYQGAFIKEFMVQRSISCKGQERNPVLELLALFG